MGQFSRAQLHGIMRSWRVIIGLVVTSAIAFATAVLAAGAFTGTVKQGYVFTRGLVLGPNGAPIWAEYLEEGSEGGAATRTTVLRVIGEAIGPLAGAFVVSGHAYRQHVQAFIARRDGLSEPVRSAWAVMSAQEYASTDFGSVQVSEPLQDQPDRFVAVGIQKTPLLPGTRWVFLRKSSTIHSRIEAQDGMILLQSPINLNAYEQIADDVRSVLLDETGAIVDRSRHNIGLRAGYWRSPPGEGQTPLPPPPPATLDVASADTYPDTGLPIMVEFSGQGAAIAIVRQLEADAANGTTRMRGSDYQSAVNAYAGVIAGNPGIALEVQPSALYAATPPVTVRVSEPRPGDPDRTVSVAVATPSLAANIRSVVLKPLSTITTREQAALGQVVLASPIDLSATVDVDAGADVLLGPDGRLRDKSSGANRLGYRTRGFAPGSENFGASDAASGLSEDDDPIPRVQGAIPWAPIAGIRVSSTLPQPSLGTTDSKGHFTLSYKLPPCPGFSFEFNHKLVAEIKYSEFNPRRSTGSYYAATPVSDFCNGSGFGVGGFTGSSLAGTNASIGGPPGRVDLAVDVVVLAGRGEVQNPDGTVVAPGATRYEYTPPSPVTQPGGPGRADDPPPQFRHQGLLTGIEREDLLHTALYVYRVSNDQLITSRETLTREPGAFYQSAGVFEDAARFFYKITTRGPRNQDYLTGDLVAFQQSTGVPLDLQGYGADHLRPGEAVKLIAINRRTGYMGSILTTTSNLADPTALPPLVLRPPNVKVWAERTFDQVSRNFLNTAGSRSSASLAGHEGTGLTSDKILAIYTEWLDHDGASLPVDLPGFTARLAKVTGPNQLSEASAGSVSHFSIRPGLATQVLKLSGSEAGAAGHYYIQVDPASSDQLATFDDANPTVPKRPTRYVPILAPVADEARTRLLADADVRSKRRVAAVRDYAALMTRAAGQAQSVLAIVQSLSAEEVAAVGPGNLQRIIALAQTLEPEGARARSIQEAATAALADRRTEGHFAALAPVFEQIALLRGMETDATAVLDLDLRVPALRPALSMAGYLLVSLDYAVVIEAGGTGQARQILAEAAWLERRGEYGWFYRPEYQVSLVQLELQELELTTRLWSPGRDDPEHGPRNQSQAVLEYILGQGSYAPLPSYGLPPVLLLALGYLERVLTPGGTSQTAQIGDTDPNTPTTDLEAQLAEALRSENYALEEVLRSYSAADLLALQLYVNQDAANGLYGAVGLPPILAQSHRLELSRRTLASAFEPQEEASLPVAMESDDFVRIDFQLLTPSKVTVSLLDGQEAKKAELVPGQILDAGPHWFYVSFGDIQNTNTQLEPRRGTDYYVELTAEVVATPTTPHAIHRFLYPGELEPGRDGRMLGQNVVHDVLVQDGSLTLSRGDLGLPGRGPALAFVRSYSNLATDTDGVLGQGWTHSLDITLRALAFGQPEEHDAAVPFNLPKKVFDAKGKFDEPANQLSPEQDDEYLLISVSNGGVFKKVSQDGEASWVPQRGHHGRLEEDAGHRGFTFTSKDGTRYRFEAPSADGEDACLQPGAIPIEDLLYTRIGVLPETFRLRHSLPSSPPSARGVSWIKDRNDNTMRFAYERRFDDVQTQADRALCRAASRRATDVLSKVTDAVNRTLFFSYGKIGGAQRLLAIRGPDERSTISFAYEVHELPPDEGPSKEPRQVALLNAVTRNETATERYAYAQEKQHDAFNLVEAKDPNGNPTTFIWNAPDTFSDTSQAMGFDVNDEDVMRELRYADGAQVRFAYGFAPGAANIRTVTDPRDNATTYTLNYTGNPQRIVEPLGRTTTFQWSIDAGLADNLLIAKTDALNRTWTYAYDSQGNVTSETDPTGQATSSSWDESYSLLESRVDRNGVRRGWEYDGRGNLIAEIDGNGLTTAHSVAANGDRLGTTDRRGNTTTFAYDAWGLLNTVARPLGARTEYANDIRGRRLSMVDPNGNAYRYEYDALDRLATEIDPLGGRRAYAFDPAGNKTKEIGKTGLILTYTHDARNRVTGVQRTGQGTGIQATRAFAYDKNGNLTSETDWKGQATVHAYDALNRRTLTTDRLGQEWKSAYDLAGNKTSESTPRGRTDLHAYDDLDRRTSTVQANLRTLAWTYDADGHVKTTTDGEGHVTTTDYDNEYRVIATSESDLRTIAYAYDGEGNRISVTDARDAITTTHYDALNRPTRVDQAGLRATTASYDKNGNRTAETTGRGYPRTYGYDALNRQIAMTAADGGEWSYGYDANGNRTGITDPNNHSTKWVYDSLDRVTIETSADGAVTAMVYDPNNNMVSRRNPRGALSTRTYDVLDRLVTEDHAGIQALTYAYDAAGNRTSVRNGRGHSTITSFDMLDRAVATEESGLRWTITDYDLDDKVVSFTNGRGIETTTEYDALHRAVLVTDGDGLRTRRREYDLNDNLVTSVDGNGNVTTTAYDALNRPTLIDPPEAGSIIQAFDADNNMVSHIDEAGQLTAFSYDSESRQTGRSNAANETTSSEYDLAGNRTVLTYPAGNRWIYTYEAVNRLASVTLPSGTTSYAYDRAGNLVTQTDARSNVTSFTYDLLDRRTGMTQPGGGRIAYVYDAEGNKTEVTDAKNQVFAYEYDALDRMTRASNPAVAYAYDLNDNLIQVEEQRDDTTDITLYTYDVLDRPTVHNQRGTPVSTRYDVEGNKLSVTSPRGTTTYAYDGRNRITQANGVSYSYLPDGKKHAIAYPNGVTTEYAYDDADRIARIDHGTLASTLQRIDYTYDKNGNRITEFESGETSRSLAYHYDSTDRLTGYEETPSPRGRGQGARSVQYTLDAVGNRTAESVSESRWLPDADDAESESLQTVLVQRTIDYDADNRRTRSTTMVSPTAVRQADQAGQSEFAYDPNGNLTSQAFTPEHDAGESPVVRNRTYVYDVKDRLIAASDGPTSLGRYRYDYRDLRIHHEDPSRGSVDTLYDGNQVLEESGSVSARYLRGHALLGIEEAGEINYAQLDSLNTTRLLTDATAGEAVRYTLDPWGRVDEQEGSTTNRQIFTGHEQDEGTGLIYMKGRYYDPEGGIFVTADTYLGKPESPNTLNRYSYAHANPLVHIDPDGRASIYFDGTWNDKEDYETVASDRDTNVARLFDHVDPTKERFAFYFSGVGTRVSKLNAVKEGAIGIGVLERVRMAIERLTKVYNDESATEEEKRINIFGFSRGATEARLLVAHIARYGIPRKIGVDGAGNPIFGKKPFRPKVNFLGLYDSVNSTKGQGVQERDLVVDPAFVAHTVHLVAADEMRASFPVDSIQNPDRPSPANLEEYFVPGVHSDVGGGIKRGDQNKSNALAYVYLLYMMRKAEAHGVPAYAPLTEGELSKLERVHLGGGEYSGFTHESRTGLWAWEPIFLRDNRGINYPANGTKTKTRHWKMRMWSDRDRIVPKTLERQMPEFELFGPVPAQASSSD